MKAAISHRIEQSIKSRVFPGCVVGVVKKRGERIVVPFGRFTYEDSSAPVKEDTIYDVASITKSIPTNSLLLTLVGEGKVKLNDPVVKYVPEFGNYENKKAVAVKNLLTYTLDLDVPSMASLKTKTADEIIDIIVKAPLKSAPGAKFLYTNSTTLVTGLLIRNVSSRNINDLADEKFFQPLGMPRTTFRPEKFPKEEIAPTEFDDWRGRLIQGEVHDESTYILNQKFILGISGLFSTVPDLLNFLEMLVNGGKLNGKEYFTPEIFKTMTTNQIADIGQSTGLGWELNQSRFMGKNSVHIFGKTGFTGCLVLCDPVKGVGMAFLSNTVYPKLKPDSTLINEVRRNLADIVFGRE